MKREDDKIHELSYENEKILKEVKNCACFYCYKRYDVSEINEWIDDDNGLTAQCPHCKVDSVIPAIIEGREVSDEDLKLMNEQWF